MVEEGAWCWFADPRALHYENAAGTVDVTWTGCIDVHGNIKAVQTDWVKGVTETVLVRSWFQPDDHDTPTFQVLPDGRVMIIYSRHTDEKCFYYRISRKPYDITVLGDEKVLPTADNTTYPNPFILSDDPDHLYLCWRGIGWHPTIARLTLPDAHDDMRFDWGPFQMMQSTGARPYAKYVSDGKSRIYVAYTTGHPDNEYPNWLYCNVFDINTKQLSSLDGEVLSTIGPAPVARTAAYAASHPKAVVDRPEDVRDWIWSMALDSLQRPVIGMTRISQDKQHHEYWYASWTGEDWKVTFLADAGGFFHLSPETENCYSAGMHVDRDHPRDVYCAVPVDGVYEIMKYTLDKDAAKVVSAEQVTKGSQHNNSRPFTIDGERAGRPRLLWMQGDYYFWIVNTKYPKGFPTSIRSDMPLRMAKTDDKNRFTFEWTPDPGAYGGEVFTWKGWRFAVDPETLYPQVSRDGKTWTSCNKMATADSWATDNERTTGGTWFRPLPYKTCTLQLHWSGTTLTVLRNGMIDLRLEDVPEAPRK